MDKSKVNVNAKAKSKTTSTSSSLWKNNSKAKVDNKDKDKDTDKSKSKVIQRKEPKFYGTDPTIMSFRLSQTPPRKPPPIYTPRPKSLDPKPVVESPNYGFKPPAFLTKDGKSPDDEEYGYIYFYVPFDKKERTKMLTPSDGIHMSIIDKIVEKRLRSKSQDHVNLSAITSRNSIVSKKNNQSSRKKPDIYRYMQLPLKSEIDDNTSLIKFRQLHHRNHAVPSRYPKIPLAPSKMVQISRSIEAKVHEMERAELKKEEERKKLLNQKGNQKGNQKAKSKSIKDGNANSNQKKQTAPSMASYSKNQGKTTTPAAPKANAKIPSKK